MLEKHFIFPFQLGINLFWERVISKEKKFLTEEGNDFFNKNFTTRYYKVLILYL